MENGVEIKNLDNYIELLSQLSYASQKDAFEILKDTTFKMQSSISKRVRDGRDGSLTSRSGELRRSIKTKSTGNDLQTAQVSVLSDSPYALIHEKGGTINAKSAFLHLQGGPYLAIPSEQNQSSSGVTIKTPRQSFMTGSYVIPINGLNADYMIMGASNEPEHWLVGSVDIPARFEFVETAKKEIPTMLSRINELLDKVAQDNV